MSARLILGDCLSEMNYLDDDSIDAVVTDPPYGWSFMGKSWDRGVPGRPFWAEALRTAKPGCHLVAFGGTRTWHRLACSIEEAGWELRDTLCWLYFSGFPKSLNLFGAWSGFGTALKPSWEGILLARKPLEGTVEANVERYGCGVLNIDGCWIGSRWPANVVLDEAAGRMLDAHVDMRVFGARKAGVRKGLGYHGAGGDGGPAIAGSVGGPSRFFYCAKASRAERDVGCEGLPMRTGGGLTGRQEGSAGTMSPRAGAGRTSGGRNLHPAVKPLALMRWLCRLVTPPGGVILDPFMGSGSTGVIALAEGFGFVGIELDSSYMEIAECRISAQERACLSFEKQKSRQNRRRPPVRGQRMVSTP